MADSTIVTEVTANSCDIFDSRINSWAEGMLLTLDADNSTLTIRGSVRPYASEYAKMLKKIHEKTTKLTLDERAAKAAEIRLEWTSALGKAREQEPQKDSDFTFHLPGKDEKLVIVDETPFYNRETQIVTFDAKIGALTDKECKAIEALKEMKIGEYVVVGYESGLIRNSAHVVIKANSGSFK
jgi:hypothetical protein